MEFIPSSKMKCPKSVF